MAGFVMVVNGVPAAGFNKIMEVVTESKGGIVFIPHSLQDKNVNTSGMSGPDDKGIYNVVRLQFDHPQVELVKKILDAFAGAPAPTATK